VCACVCEREWCVCVCKREEREIEKCVHVCVRESGVCVCVCMKARGQPQLLLQLSGSFHFTIEMWFLFEFGPHQGS